MDRSENVEVVYRLVQTQLKILDNGGIKHENEIVGINASIVRT